MVWFGEVRSGMVCFGYNIYVYCGLVGLGRVGWGAVWLGMVWFGYNIYVYCGLVGLGRVW